MKITVCLPIYNEEDNLIPLIGQIKVELAKIPASRKIILAIDDASTDQSLAVLKKIAKNTSNLVIIKHHHNQGLAGGIRSALTYGQRNNIDIIVLMDADQTHNPTDVITLVEKINQGYDLVIGSRYVAGGQMIGVPKSREYLSRIASHIFRQLLVVPTRDLTSGYRALRPKSFSKIELSEQNFCIQLEMVIKAYQAGCKVGEIPIVLTNRKFGVSKMKYNLPLWRDYGILLVKLFLLRARRNNVG